MLDTIRDEVKKRQLQVRVEKAQDAKEQLKRALVRIKGDFGKRCRTYKAALLKNPPSIPLWGVFTSHPDTITFKTWTVEQVGAKAAGMKGEHEIRQEEDGGVRVHCARHDDVARVVLNAPPGECKISNQGPERLVADTSNKLCGSACCIVIRSGS